MVLCTSATKRVMSTVCVNVKFRLSLRPLLVNVAIPYLRAIGSIVRACVFTALG
jgi:hypothetical protein